jgi:metallo-beta-lactamase family protein
MIEVEIGETNEQPIRVLFSGDVGRYNAPVYHNPSPPPACDYLICESTYGDREHPSGNVMDQLEATINAAVRRGGVILVPAFAVGRSQQLIYLLQLLAHHRRIPELPIYLDSPMAVDATAIYCSYRPDHDLSEGQLAENNSVFNGRNVHFVRTVQESKQLNGFDGPGVIIASSGMMTGGRILHHLEHRLDDPRNTILLGGFMAAGTRGRALEDGAERIRMHGRDVRVRAAVAKIAGLSCHADRSELMRWLRPLPAPRRAFITHGEPASAASFADLLRTERGWDVHVPRLGESIALQ